MIPRTEEELEIYFKLKEVECAREARHKKPFGIGSSTIPIDYYEAKYQKVKKEYLELVNR